MEISTVCAQIEQLRQVLRDSTISEQDRLRTKGQLLHLLKRVTELSEKG